MELSKQVQDMINLVKAQLVVMLNEAKGMFTMAELHKEWNELLESYKVKVD